MLEAVVFDMDGVIVDSEPLHIKSEKQVFARYGVHLSDEELRDYMGRSSRLLFEDLIKKYTLDIALEDIYPSHIENLVRLYKEESDPIPGALELIEDLNIRGIELALASSSDHALIAAFLEKFWDSHVFHVVVSGQDVSHTKPHPAIFLEAVGRLGHPAEACVVIEDSQAGVLASKRAGIPCVGFRSPHSLSQNLSEATLVVDDLRELNYDRLNSLVDSV